MPNPSTPCGRATAEPTLWLFHRWPARRVVNSAAVFYPGPYGKGLSTDSLKFHAGPPYPALIRPCGRATPKRLYSRLGGGPPTGRAAFGHLLPPWIPLPVRTCFYPFEHPKSYTCFNEFSIVFSSCFLSSGKFPEQDFAKAPKQFPMSYLKCFKCFKCSSRRILFTISQVFHSCFL
jgi:hypothetical protein